jgi:hypothetical protein
LRIFFPVTVQLMTPEKLILMVDPKLI